LPGFQLFAGICEPRWVWATMPLAKALLTCHRGVP
jgi:hypothetical protein